jgi:hypothetical protein
MFHLHAQTSLHQSASAINPHPSINLASLL